MKSSNIVLAAVVFVLLIILVAAIMHTFVGKFSVVGTRLGGGGPSTTTTSLPLCNPADMDGNGNVDQLDYLRFKLNSGRKDCVVENECCSRSDTNMDGVVNYLDLMELDENFGSLTGECRLGGLKCPHEGLQHNEFCTNDSDCAGNLSCKLHGDYPELGSRCCYAGECSSTDGCVGEGTVFFGGTDDEIACLGGVWVPTNVTLRLAALKTDPASSGGDVVSDIQAVLSAKPGLDLIVTPEYSFYGGRYNEQTPRIRVDCADGSCTIQNLDGGEGLINKINQIAAMASANDVNIIVGTVPTQETVASSDPNLTTPLFNSLIVFDRQGNLVFKKMKTTGSDWCMPAKDGKIYHCGWSGYDIGEESHQKALDSSRALTLTSRMGKPFTVFTSICADLDDSEMVSQGDGANANLLVWSTVNGADLQVEVITRDIQDYNTSDYWGWIESGIIQPYVINTNTIQGNGFFITSDFSQSGIINLKKKPLQELEITDEYVYGRITIQN